MLAVITHALGTIWNGATVYFKNALGNPLIGSQVRRSGRSTLLLLAKHYPNTITRSDHKAVLAEKLLSPS